MNIELIAETLELFGAVFIAFAALRVHHRVLNEHKMDRDVFKVMKREQWIGIIGVLMLIVGFLLKASAIL